jgi:hypothetical protein
MDARARLRICQQAPSSEVAYDRSSIELFEPEVTPALTALGAEG